MGILSRFADIISANINALLDKAEDPAKMIDQYLLNALEDLAEVKQETANVMAEEQRCKRLLDENSQQIEKYDTLAKRALQAGNEDDARAFISRKQECTANVESYQKAYSAAHANAEKMRQLHDKLAKDVETLRSRKASIKATVAVANTQQKVNKARNAYASASGTLASFERMEQKAQQMLDEANAMAVLSDGPDSQIDDLEKKYGTASAASVDDELAQMKAQLKV